MEQNENEKELNQEVGANETNSVEETDMNMENSEVEVVTPSGSKKIVLSFVATFFIVAVIVVFVIMNVIPMISSKEKFFKISQNAGVGIGNMVEDFGDSVFGKILTIVPDEKMQIKTELDLALGTKDQELLDIIYGFKNLKLTLNQDVDFGEYYVTSDANISINDEDFVTAEVIEDEQYIALKANGITDKYLRAEKNNLQPVWQRLNMDGPAQFTTETDLFEKLQFTKAEKKEFGNTFKRVFNAVKKLYVNGDFTEGSEVVAYNNTEKELSYVDLKLTSKKLNDSVIAILEQLKKEEKSLEILVSKLNSMEDVYASMGYENTAWTSEEILSYIEDMLTEIRDFEVSEEDGMLVRVYYSGWDLDPMGMAMFMLPTDEVYDFKYAEGDNKLLVDNVAGYYEYSDQMYEYVDVVSTANKVDTHNFEIRYKNYTTGEFLTDYTEKYVITVDGSNKDKLVCNLKDLEGYIDYTLSGEIDGKVQTIGLEMHDFYEEGETNDLILTITLNRNPEFEKKVLVEGEFVDLNKATDEEFNTTISDIQTNWTAFATTNETKINQFSTIAGAYMAMLMPYDPYMYEDYSDIMYEDAQG